MKSFRPLLQSTRRPRGAVRAAVASAVIFASVIMTPRLGWAAEEIYESFIAAATNDNLRNTEADILVLRDGTLLAAWADFYGGSTDDAPARISAAKSTDGGRTWAARFTLQENIGRANVMSVSWQRLRNGDVLAPKGR